MMKKENQCVHIDLNEFVDLEKREKEEKKKVLNHKDEQNQSILKFVKLF